jgi:uncharacterized protein (TIGR02594 family)
MTIRPTTVLLVLASVTAFSASARADAPESQARGIDKTAPVGPRVEIPRVELVNTDKRAGRHAGARRPRRLTEHRVVRERTRTVHRHDNAQPRRGRLAARNVAVHNDGASAASSEQKSSSGSSQASSNSPLASLGSTVVAEARRWIGTNPTGRKSLWCARFMNFVLKRVGFSGTSSDMAKSFASYGKRLSGPKVGAIAVMNRGRSGGHVGVVSGFDSQGNPIVISGNYTHRVSEAVFSRSRIFAYVAPGK